MGDSATPPLTLSTDTGNILYVWIRVSWAIICPQNSEWPKLCPGPHSGAYRASRPLVFWDGARYPPSLRKIPHPAFGPADLCFLTHRTLKNMRGITNTCIRPGIETLLKIRWIKEAIHIRKKGQPWWGQLPTEPHIRPLSWHGVFPSCQEPEELSTSFFRWRLLMTEVETSSFR